MLGLFILNDFAFMASFEALLSLFTSLLSEAWILKTIGFAILVGSVMALIEKGGGIDGFIHYLYDKNAFVDSPRAALMLSYMIGVLIFIESSITSLIAGAVGKPLCDKQGVSRAKLAYVCDSTSAPISSIIVLNGWGALLLGLIASQIAEGMISGDSVSILIDSVMYNFYAMSALVVTFLSVWFNINIGPMKNSKPLVFQEHKFSGKNRSMWLMILPILLMVLLVFVFLYITGSGNILKGSGSSAIFYTMIATLAFIFAYYVGTKTISTKTYVKTSLEGAKKLLPIAMILLFAFAIGKVTTELKTGLYLASLADENLSIYLLGGVVFLLSSLIAFSTGTSWGTFSIMIPVAVPMAVGMDANIALCIGAVISGGVFGDHCSPISDTT
ncbi:MAG: Na+/H+ antiporter NhaC family protein, partial [Campylobacterota bacterium]|nr:Na+/H+ antiporter NhaC family protein [Campylobacterota bacterium]